jgi:hypothetical protein
MASSAYSKGLQLMLPCLSRMDYHVSVPHIDPGYWGRSGGNPRDSCWLEKLEKAPTVSRDHLLVSYKVRLVSP